MEKLDERTSKLIRHGQIITKLSDVARELIDNSIDAKCSRIQVLLENFGINQIEVRDDGHGIPAEHFHQVISGGYTSKVQNDELLSCDKEYGFRGEALSSICSLANVSILTKTSSDPYGKRYHLDDKGKVTAETVGALSKGTHVRVSDLFSKYPVRRNFIQEKNRRLNELKEIESYLKSLALANPSVHFALIHNGNTIWTKPAVASLDQSLILVFGIFVARDLAKIGPVAISTPGTKSSGTLSTIEIFTPRAPIDTKLMTQSTNKLTMIFVNRRRVHVREFEMIIQKYIDASTEMSSRSVIMRYPICVLKIQVPSEQVDFNRNIDKSKIFLMYKTEIAEKLNDMLREYYKVEISLEKKSIPKNLKLSEKVVESSGEISPVSDLIHDFNQSSILANDNDEQTDRTVPVAVLNISSPEKRNDHVLNFLDNIPTVSSSNFSRSPSKKATFDRRISGSPKIISTSGVKPSVIVNPCNLNMANENAISEHPKKVGANIVSNFNIDLNFDESQTMEIDETVSTTVIAPLNTTTTTTTTSSTKLNDMDWVRGRLKDRHGNIIESSVVLTGGMAKTSTSSLMPTKRSISASEFGVVPTTPKPTILRENSFYSGVVATPETAREKYQHFMSKMATCHSGSTMLPVSFEEPVRKRSRTVTPLFNRAPELDEEIGSGQYNFQKVPRQVTLDTLKNWKMPGSSFAKEGVVRTSISQTESTRNTNLSNISSRSDMRIQEECFPPKIPASVQKYFEKHDLLRKGLFELQESVNSREFLPQKLSTPYIAPPPQEAESKARIITNLPNTSLYIVQIDHMLGAFSPACLLEMEPALKSRIKNPLMFDNIPNKNLSVENVRVLLQEFINLSCDDYSEEMVKRVFHVLKDFNQTVETGRMEL